MLASCANLGIGTFVNGGNHRYARCCLGDSAARLARLGSHVVERESYLHLHADPDHPGLGPPPIMPPP